MAFLNRTVRFFLRHGVPTHPDKPFHDLSTTTLIGRESKRDCYAYPGNPALCIKVPRKPDKPDAQQPSIVEWYCAITLDRRRVPFKHRARCHGWVETNQGAGLVMERICNPNGRPTPTLYEWTKSRNCNPEQISDLFNELKHWVLENAVPVTDLNSGNLIVRQDEEKPYLVLIDGIGGQKVKLKFVLYRKFRWFARLLSRHRWPLLEQVAHREIEHAGHSVNSMSLQQTLYSRCPSPKATQVSTDKAECSV